jgi:hypothetical protein
MIKENLIAENECFICPLKCGFSGVKKIAFDHILSRCGFRKLLSKNILICKRDFSLFDKDELVIHLKKCEDCNIEKENKFHTDTDADVYFI